MEIGREWKWTTMAIARQVMGGQDGMGWDAGAADTGKTGKGGAARRVWLSGRPKSPTDWIAKVSHTPGTNRGSQAAGKWVQVSCSLHAPNFSLGGLRACALFRGLTSRCGAKMKSLYGQRANQF